MRSGLTCALLGMLLVAACPAANAQTLAQEFAQALRGTQASGVVLDARTGDILATVGKPMAAAPGSAIKPLLLTYALTHGIVQPETAVYCRRDLHIGTRSLPCTHPADQPLFTAERALAESCNTWFAEMGRRFTGPALEQAFIEVHIAHSPLQSATADQRELAVLGLSGSKVTPIELAQAYRAMLLRAPAEGVIVRGLRGSVEYGMASPARVPGLDILGKTGTASDPGQAWTHGWFAGAVPQQFVVVVYVPHGDGGTAALLAQHFLLLRKASTEAHSR